MTGTPNAKRRPLSTRFIGSSFVVHAVEGLHKEAWHPYLWQHYDAAGQRVVTCTMWSLYDGIDRARASRTIVIPINKHPSVNQLRALVEDTKKHLRVEAEHMLAYGRFTADDAAAPSP